MAVRWYLAYPLSTRQVLELLAKRGIDVSRRTILTLGTTAVASTPDPPFAPSSITRMTDSRGPAGKRSQHQTR